STRRPPSAISVAATRPARPAPTTITSASVAVPAPMSVDLDAVHTLAVVGAVAPAHPTALLAVVLADLAVPGLEVAHLDLRLPLEVVALVGVAVVAVDAEVHPEEHGGPREERDGDAAGPGVGIGQQRHGRRIGGQLGEQREHGSSSEKELAEADDRADHRGHGAGRAGHGEDLRVRDRNGPHGVAVAAVDRDVVHQGVARGGVGVAVQPHRHVHRDPPGAAHGHALPLPAHAAVVPVDGGHRLRARDRQELVLDVVIHVAHVEVAPLGGEVLEVVRVVDDGVLGVVRLYGIEDVVRRLLVVAGVEALGGFDRQIVHQHVEGPLDAVDVRVVVGLGALVVPAAVGDRVLARGDLAGALQHGVHVAVDHEVRDVHAHHVLGDVLLLEPAVGEGPPLLGEAVDALDRLLAGELEREHRVGDRAVGDLRADRQGLAAPVAAGLQLLVDVDDHLGTASLALQGHGGQVVADVLRAGGHGVAAQLRDRGVQAEGALGVLLVPGVAAVRADEGLRGERVLDLRAAAAGALVQPVVTAGAGVDDAVRGAPTGGLVPLVGPPRRLLLGRLLAAGGGRDRPAGPRVPGGLVRAGLLRALRGNAHHAARGPVTARARPSSPPRSPLR